MVRLKADTTDTTRVRLKADTTDAGGTETRRTRR
jgi:hypothetical protein